jgi:hypothetical protein
MFGQLCLDSRLYMNFVYGCLDMHDLDYMCMVMDLYLCVSVNVDVIYM